jgi:hypothetical protein
MLAGKKTTLEGEGMLRDDVSVKGLPCAEEIYWEGI